MRGSFRLSQKEGWKSGRDEGWIEVAFSFLPFLHPLRAISQTRFELVLDRTPTFK